MAVKTTIALIGATGNMGAAVAKSLANGPYRLLLMGKSRHKLEALQQDIMVQSGHKAETEIMLCAREACWEADVIIPAVPYAVQKAVADTIREVATGKTVISVTNPLNSGLTALETAAGSSAAEELQELLPYAKVVKAFNTIPSTGFGRPEQGGVVADCFIAGDDSAALATVSEMAAAAGFNPLIAGALDASRTLEQMALLLIRLEQRYGHNQIAGWKVLYHNQ